MPPPATAPIKTMRLYHHLTWVDTELAEKGLLASGALKVDDLLPFDGMHYHGAGAVDEGIATMGLGPTDLVLDIGAGLGGPARQMASRAGCRVVAVEMQEDISLQAEGYTARCGLPDKVHHVAADFLACNLATLGGGPGSFDHVTSWLAFLHIEDKKALLGRVASLLKPGGTLYIEDFFALGALTAAEQESLASDVFAVGLPTREAYLAALSAAGFDVEIEFTDMTASWTEFVTSRRKQWIKNQERTVRVHDSAFYQARLHFFSAMKVLFEGGRLGGVRIYAKMSQDGIR